MDELCGSIKLTASEDGSDRDSASRKVIIPINQIISVTPVAKSAGFGARLVLLEPSPMSGHWMFKEQRPSRRELFVKEKYDTVQWLRANTKMGQIKDEMDYWNWVTTLDHDVKGVWKKS